MRPSNRERIIAGALEIIAREGIDALAFEVLAEEVGLTRGGIVYHFRTRDDLMAGIASDLLMRWKNEALAALGRPVEEATRTERMIALTTSVLDGALLPGEFAFLISGRPEAVGLNRAWDDFLHEWTGDPLTLTPAQRVGLLAINGGGLNSPSGRTMAARWTPRRADSSSLSSLAGDSSSEGRGLHEMLGIVGEP